MEEHEEKQYLGIVRKLIRSGNEKQDRTGVGTRSLFGFQMRFNLQKGFPLLTTKHIFWRGVVEELLWFIRGSTDATELSERNVNIWNENASRKYLDSIGLTEREEGDLGPVYGFQWRHYGAKYDSCKSDYTKCGFDQLRNVIEKLMITPHDRRNIISSWNPIDIPQMALPPCHCFVQFYCHNNKLSCQLYQRSADVGLGVPFNIVSYSLLTLIIAKATGMVAGEFIHTLGDAHVYSNHIDGLSQQIERVPYSFPEVVIKKDLFSKDVDQILKNLESLSFKDFELKNYKFHPKICLPFAV
ncbi:MAG: thymidylate synthase [Cetobacterium sp.]